MQNLYSLRKAKGYSQQEIAEKLNVCQATYSHWENGYNKPQRKYLAPLAAILGVTAEELVRALPGHPPAHYL